MIQSQDLNFLILYKEIKAKFELNNNLWSSDIGIQREQWIPTRPWMNCLGLVTHVTNNEWIMNGEVIVSYANLMTTADDLGHLKYQNIARFAVDVLSLPPSNTDVERLFSKLNIVKRKQGKCLRMKSTSSLMALSEIAKGNCRTTESYSEIILCPAKYFYGWGLYTIHLAACFTLTFYFVIRKLFYVFVKTAHLSYFWHFIYNIIWSGRCLKLSK